jgi:hypothetical protein
MNHPKPIPAIEATLPASRTELETIDKMAARLLRRVRIIASFTCAVEGTFFGLCAAVLLTFLHGLLVLHFPALAAAATIVGIGTLTGAVVGALRRQDKKAVLIRGDRLMGSRDLMSTAYGLLNTRRRTFFEQAILEDAARLMKNLDPRLVVPVTRPATLKFIPLPALAAILLLLVPIALQHLPSAELRPGARLQAFTKELEGVARDLEQQARKRDEPRAPELAQELRRLSQDLKSGTIDRSEALRRLSELQGGAEIALKLEQSTRMATTPASESAPNGMANAEGLRKGGEEAWGSGQENNDILPTESLPKNPDDPKSPFYTTVGRDVGDSVSKGSGATKGGAIEDTQEYTGEGSMAGGGGEGPEWGQSTFPGDRPVDDQRGRPSKVLTGNAQDPLAVEVQQTRGDTLKTIVRALPGWFASQVGEEEVLRSYSKQAESALVREEIPQELRKYVKNYFLVISMIKHAE